jgi:hypothetical protein
MFNLTITTYSKNLGNLKTILEKAKAWQTAQKINDETIMNARPAAVLFAKLVVERT